jgi:hypothetical protein
VRSSSAGTLQSTERMFSYDADSKVNTCSMSSVDGARFAGRRDSYGVTERARGGRATSLPDQPRTASNHAELPFETDEQRHRSAREDRGVAASVRRVAVRRRRRVQGAAPSNVPGTARRAVVSILPLRWKHLPGGLRRVHLPAAAATTDRRRAPRRRRDPVPWAAPAPATPLRQAPRARLAAPMTTADRVRTAPAIPFPTAAPG